MRPVLSLLMTQDAPGAQACADAPVSHAVMFSSIAALTGPAGSANYAAANAALDSLCHSQQSQGADTAAHGLLELVIVIMLGSSCTVSSPAKQHAN